MSNRRTALSLSIAFACFALAACSDAPTAPSATEPTDEIARAVAAQDTSALTPQDVAIDRIEALRDALYRVQPTLVGDERSTALGVGLRQAIEALERNEEKSARSALQRVDHTLQRYAQGDNAMSPDLDVIRLAVSGANAR